MGQDGSQTIPVTVTVQHATPTSSVPGAHPPGQLSFTGSPVDILAPLGLALAAVGTATLVAVRRHRPSKGGLL